MLSKLNLLIIEDEIFLAKSLIRLLSRHFKSVYVAYDSFSGLELSKTGYYDVILSDWDCPEKGSGQIILDNTAIPTVIHTGSSDVFPENIIKIEKPSEIETILTALEIAISRSTS